MFLSPKTWPFVMGTVVALLVLAAPAGAWTRDVHPGESIQAAIDAANPGDTINVAAGVYHENLTITKDGINLRGEGASAAGTVLTPGATPTPSICTDPESGAVNGICVAGELNPQTGEPGRPVQGVTIKGFLVDGYSGDGVVAFVANDLTVKGTKARNNQGYGISGFQLSGVRFKHDVARDNGEPGFYVGDSPHADALLIGNAAIHNGAGSQEGFGFFLRDSSEGFVKGNFATANCIGFVFLDSGENPDPVNDWTAKHNVAFANNEACPSGSEGGPSTSGTGIALGGTHNVTVRRNLVFDNKPSLENPFAGGIVVASTTALGGADPSDNVVKKNLAHDNAPADIVWDGTGQGNVFDRNLCGTSIPDGLCVGQPDD
jgi:Right handed beta helix region